MNKKFFTSNAPLVITNERTLLSVLDGLESFIFKLSKVEDPIFFKITESNLFIHGTKIEVINPLGEVLIHILENLYKFEDQYILQTYPDHIGKFIELFKENKLLLDYLKFPSLENDKKFVEEISEFTSKLKEWLDLDETKKKLESIKRAERKNKQSLKEYITKLSNRQKNISVVCFDVHYKNHEDHGQIPLEDLHTSYSTVELHRQKFIKLLIKNHGKWILGNAWKLEYIFMGHYSYKFLLFFNSDQLSQNPSFNVVAAITETWKAVTQDIQSHYLVHVSMYLTRSNRLAVLEKIKYWASKDLYIKLLIPEGKRSFGKSFILS